MMFGLFPDAAPRILPYLRPAIANLRPFLLAYTLPTPSPSPPAPSRVLFNVAQLCILHKFARV